MAGGRKILVTGASGFIGGSLCKVLVERGFSVTALVRSENGLPCKGVHCLVQDLEREFDEDVFAGGFDAVVHLAGKAHGKGGANEQTFEAFERSNVAPTRRLAECLAAGSTQRFIYLSSIGVHGDSTLGSPITEQSGERPHADYARSKLQGEMALRESLAGSTTAFPLFGLHWFMERMLREILAGLSLCAVEICRCPYAMRIIGEAWSRWMLWSS